MELPDLKTQKERLQWAAHRAGCNSSADFFRKLGEKGSESGVRHHFNGTRQLSMAAARAYAAALGVSWAWLMGGGDASIPGDDPQAEGDTVSLTLAEIKDCIQVMGEVQLPDAKPVLALQLALDALLHVRDVEASSVEPVDGVARRHLLRAFFGAVKNVRKNGK